MRRCASGWASLWGVQPPAEPGLSYDQMVAGGVRALFVMGANPAADAHCRGAAQAGLPGRAGPVPDRDRAIGRRGAAGVPASPRRMAPTPTWNAASSARRRASGPWAKPRRLGHPDRPGRALAGGREQGRTCADRRRTAAPPTSPIGRRKKRKVKTGPAPKPWNYPDVSGGAGRDRQGRAGLCGLRWEALGERARNGASAVLRPARRLEPVEVAPPAAGRQLLAG